MRHLIKADFKLAKAVINFFEKLLNAPIDDLGGRTCANHLCPFFNIGCTAKYRDKVARVQ